MCTNSSGRRKTIVTPSTARSTRSRAPSVAVRSSLASTRAASLRRSSAGTTTGLRSAGAFDPDRQLRAGVRGPAGEVREPGVDGPPVDHRIPPFVEADVLGEQLGAEAVGLAGDRIDPDP